MRLNSLALATLLIATSQELWPFNGDNTAGGGLKQAISSGKCRCKEGYKCRTVDNVATECSFPMEVPNISSCTMTMAEMPAPQAPEIPIVEATMTEMPLPAPTQVYGSPTVGAAAGTMSTYGPPPPSMTYGPETPQVSPANEMTYGAPPVKNEVKAPEIPIAAPAKEQQQVPTYGVPAMGKSPEVPAVSPEKQQQTPTYGAPAMGKRPEMPAVLPEKAPEVPTTLPEKQQQAPTYGAPAMGKNPETPAVTPEKAPEVPATLPEKQQQAPTYGRPAMGKSPEMPAVSPEKEQQAGSYRPLGKMPTISPIPSKEISRQLDYGRPPETKAPTKEANQPPKCTEKQKVPVVVSPEKEVQSPARIVAQPAVGNIEKSPAQATKFEVSREKETNVQLEVESKAVEQVTQTSNCPKVVAMPRIKCACYYVQDGKIVDTLMQCSAAKIIDP